MSEFIREFLTAERDRHSATLRGLLVELREHPLPRTPEAEEPKKVNPGHYVRKFESRTSIARSQPALQAPNPTLD